VHGKVYPHAKSTGVSLGSGSLSLPLKCVGRSCVNIANTSYAHIEGPTPLAEMESAVRGTMKRMNTKALAPVKRQSEINRRIRSVHQVVRPLRQLAAEPTFNQPGTEPMPPVGSTAQPMLGMIAQEQNTRADG